MSITDNISPEMRLFSPEGERLYLNDAERDQFIMSSDDENPSERMFCHLLHETGCRPSEALALTARGVLVVDDTIVLRCLKKHKVDSKGRVKQAQYRSVPVSPSLIKYLDLVFDIRARQNKPKQIDDLLWSMSRPTAYRLVKRVMNRAGIVGKQATGKGLRHGYGVAMMNSDNPLPLHLLSEALGHSDTKTTEIYLKAVGKEKHKLFMAAWQR